VAAVADVAEIDAAGLSTRQVNQRIKQLAGEGHGSIRVKHPAARHSLCVALFDPVTVVFDGPVGWYCAGMLDGGEVAVRGSCGWAVAEGMQSGAVTVHGHAGSGTGASMFGGTLVVRGDAGARTGISMKGGALVVAGDTGYMAGFMMQQGVLVIAGDAGEGLGDSMYEGTIYLGGVCPDLGADAVPDPMHAGDEDALRDLLAPHAIQPKSGSWTKIRAGRKLWTFSRKDYATWGSAL
jgi:glutamate synthase domain-containing protein 3